MGATGGFSELQLSSDVYRVAFRGNGYTSPDRVIDFALLRAAELTLLQGARYFVVVNEGRDSSQQLVGGGYTTGTMAPMVGGGCSFTGNTAPPVLVRRHSAELVIRLVPEPSLPGVTVYSAELIRDQVRQKYGITP
jgi:hypothetical protein